MGKLVLLGGGMAQQLRTVAAPPEDPGMVPVTNVIAHNCF